MNVEELFQRAELGAVDGSFSRIDEQHPIGLFIGVDGGRRCILIVCQQRPPEPPPIGALDVEIRPRATGEWALSIRLERPDLAPLFTHLVEDLAAATLRSPAAPGQTVVHRLIRWQRMLERGTTALLDDIEIRGLIAELSFLLDEAVPHVGLERAIAAWVGPFGAPKDFVFGDREVEIKATTRQPRALRISSFEQLTKVGVPLYLWTRPVVLDGQGAVGTAHACTWWVRRGRAAFAPTAIGAEQLEECLRAAGWEDRPEYESRFVHLGSATSYLVEGAFPRIERSTIAAGVIDGRYRIDVASLSPFISSDWKGAQVG